MTGNDRANITIRLPDQLAESVQMLTSATGRDTYDIVTSALRTYLADQIQRDTIRAHFEALPETYPQAYFVTATARLSDDVVVDETLRHNVEQTFAQINRYAPTRLDWGPLSARKITVGMGVSGHTSAQAAETAAKMVRNRLVDEHRLTLDERDGGICVVAVVALPTG